MLRLGIEGDDVAILHQLLGLYFNREITASKVFSSDTKKLIQDFQVKKGLVPDGIVGSKTLAALWGEFSSAVLSPNRNVLAPKKYSFVKCDADKYVDSLTRKQAGFSALYLREDVSQAYQKAMAEIRSYGALVTTAGGRRWFSSAVSAGRSSTSLHYAGLAFDLGTTSGMQDIDKDAYVVQRIAPRTYRVYARCDKNKATHEDFPKRKTTIKDCITYFDRVEGKTCKADYFIDITAIFENYGFKSIKSHNGFEEAKHPAMMMSAEWWHFQKEDVLQEGVSTFGGELLKIAPETEIKKYPHLWANRNKVWKKDWF